MEKNLVPTEESVVRVKKLSQRTAQPRAWCTESIRQIHDAYTTMNPTIPIRSCFSHSVVIQPRLQIEAQPHGCEGFFGSIQTFCLSFYL